MSWGLKHHSPAQGPLKQRGDEGKPAGSPFFTFIYPVANPEVAVGSGLSCVPKQLWMSLGLGLAGQGVCAGLALAITPVVLVWVTQS